MAVEHRFYEKIVHQNTELRTKRDIISQNVSKWNNE